MHVQLSSGTQVHFFGVVLRLPPYFEYASCELSDVQSRLSLRCSLKRYQKLMCGLNCIYNYHGNEISEREINTK